LETRSPEVETPAKGGQINMKDGCYIDITGAEVWVKDGEYHREDGPAIIWKNGTKIWRKNGNLHREDGPAIIYPNGVEEWWLNDQKLNKVLQRIEVQKLKRKEKEKLKTIKELI